MADLIDRLSGESLPSRPKLPAHQFIGGLSLYAEGLVSRGELASNWDLQGAEATQAGLVADEIDLAIGLTNKINYVLRFDAIAMLIEDTADQIYHAGGIVDKAKVISHTGI